METGAEEMNNSEKSLTHSQFCSLYLVFDAFVVLQKMVELSKTLFYFIFEVGMTFLHGCCRPAEKAHGVSLDLLLCFPENKT